MRIISDIGTPYGARVTVKNRLSTEAVTKTEQQQAGTDGDGYLVSSPIVNLTSANQSAIIYLKNNELRDLMSIPYGSIKLNT